MSNKEKSIREHAADMLFRFQMADGCILPAVYVVGKQVFPFINVARRAAYPNYGRIVRIGAREAYELLHHGKMMPPDMEMRISRLEYDGALFAGGRLFENNYQVLILKDF